LVSKGRNIALSHPPPPSWLLPVKLRTTMPSSFLLKTDSCFQHIFQDSGCALGCTSGFVPCQSLSVGVVRTTAASVTQSSSTQCRNAYSPLFDSPRLYYQRTVCFTGIPGARGVSIGRAASQIVIACRKTEFVGSACFILPHRTRNGCRMRYLTWHPGGTQYIHGFHTRDVARLFGLTV